MEDKLLENINLNGEVLKIADSKARQNIENIKNTLNSLSTVATSGNYNDLTDKPSIPSFNYADITLNIV